MKCDNSYIYLFFESWSIFSYVRNFRLLKRIAVFCPIAALPWLQLTYLHVSASSYSSITATEFFSLFPKQDWLSTVAGKQAAFHAIAEYQQSLQAKEAKNFGEEIARLRVSYVDCYVDYLVLFSRILLNCHHFLFRWGVDMIKLPVVHLLCGRSRVAQI